MKKNNFTISLPARMIVYLVVIYQRTLSPDHGWFRGRYPYGYCRFYPTCSEYAKQSLEKFGLIKGAWLSAKRLIKCNPWTDAKIDLIPN